MKTAKGSAKRVVALAAFLALSSMTLAKGLPESGDGSLGSGFEFSDYYVGAGDCSSSCFRLATQANCPVWTIEVRNPSGSQTHFESGLVVWDEDEDGNDEPVNMDSYRIEADVHTAVATGDGKVHVVILLTVIKKRTQEKVHSESFNRTYDQSIMAGQ